MRIKMLKHWNGFIDNVHRSFPPGTVLEGKSAEFVKASQPGWSEVLDEQLLLVPNPQAGPSVAEDGDDVKGPLNDKMMKPGQAVEKLSVAFELAKLSINELRRLASRKGIQGVGSMTKADLIEKLSAADGE